MELTPIQRLAYDTIAEILEIKQGNTAPCLAHISEIRRSLNIELLEALRDLYRKGIVSVNKDINGHPMFAITNPV